MSGLLASLVLIGGFIAFLAIFLFFVGLAVYFMYRTGSR
jgi:cbb3-type cytochrome oxidase subunit 3